MLSFAPPHLGRSWLVEVGGGSSGNEIEWTLVYLVSAANLAQLEGSRAEALWVLLGNEQTEKSEINVPRLVYVCTWK